MEGKEIKVTCPECKYVIDVDEILYHQIEDRIQEEYKQKLAEQKRNYEEQKLQLEQSLEEFNKQKENFDQTVQEAVKKQVETETSVLREKLKKEIEDEQSEQFKSLQEELNEKSEQLKDYNKSKAEIERLKREKDELADKIKAEAEQKLTEILAVEKEKIQKSVQDNMQLKISDKEQIIEQLRAQLIEAQRKAEQGSQQLQGEVQELAIEEFLRAKFPLDTVEEIKKGARGGDCLQHVNTEYRRNCGSIYYESKRAKNFQPSWIEKFKDDMRTKNAFTGVLVTETMPSDMERMGFVEGIWICSLEEFKGLCFVLRESIIQISDILSSQENKGDKMSMIYAYLTSDEFRYQIESIVEGFTDMKKDLDKEKSAVQGLWKKREKQIEKVLLNTNMMYNSIKGIAGNSIGTIKALELSAPDEAQNEGDGMDKELEVQS